MSKDVNLTFSENLARLRKMKGLSQGDLAKLSGLTRRIIGHYENEAVEPPLRNIRAIADALGVRISELLDETRNLAKQSNDLTDIDPRSVKKLKDILSLPQKIGMTSIESSTRCSKRTNWRHKKNLQANFLILLPFQSTIVLVPKEAICILLIV
jgi:transcriptional regulator with XRE-family HTH domain